MPSSAFKTCVLCGQPLAKHQPHCDRCGMAQTPSRLPRLPRYALAVVFALLVVSAAYIGWNPQHPPRIKGDWLSSGDYSPEYLLHFDSDGYGKINDVSEPMDVYSYKRENDAFTWYVESWHLDGEHLHFSHDLSARGFKMGVNPPCRLSEDGETLILTDKDGRPIRFKRVGPAED